MTFTGIGSLAAPVFLGSSGFAFFVFRYHPEADPQAGRSTQIEAVSRPAVEWPTRPGTAA
jgi:hypothetical protein